MLYEVPLYPSWIYIKARDHAPFLQFQREGNTQTNAILSLRGTGHFWEFFFVFWSDFKYISGSTGYFFY